MKVIRISVAQALPPMVFILLVDVGLVIGMILSGDVSYDEVDLVVDEFGRATRREFRCNSKVIIYTHVSQCKIHCCIVFVHILLKYI